MKGGVFFLFLVFLLSSTQQSPTKISLFAGQGIEDETSRKIAIYPDLASNVTIISSNDFVCSDANSCELSPENFTMNISGKTVVYQEAYLQLNVIVKPFAEKMKVIYLPNDIYNIGSIVGLRSGSSFLNYLYDQNAKNGYMVRFVLDSQNKLQFLDPTSQERNEKLEYEMGAKVSYFNSTTVPVESNIRFCISNSVDRTGNLVYFSVRPEQLEGWKTMVRTNAMNINSKGTKNYTQNAVRFWLSPQISTNMGDLYVTFDELIQNGSILIGSIGSEAEQQRNCDVITGTLLLDKYKFLFYYTEYTQGYDVKFSFDNAKDRENIYSEKQGKEEKAHGFWWKIILFVIIIGGAGCGGYYYLNREKKPVEVYHSQVQEEYEMNMLSAVKPGESEKKADRK